MESLATVFVPLLAAITQTNQKHGLDAHHPWHHQLTVREADGLLDVAYHGEYELWFDEQATVRILHDLLNLLASDEVAPRLTSFSFSTEAVLAANGTYEYNIDPLIAEGQRFPNLRQLSLDQGEGEHGYKILTSPLLGDDWHEAGVLARLLDQAPHLENLKTPISPHSSFYRGHQHSLRSLDVDAGYDQAAFIRQLAGCLRFPDLRRLVFTDYRQDYMEDWRAQTTSFDEYVSFFQSPLAAQLESIHLREVSLTHDQIHHLLAMRSEGVQITCYQQAT